MPPIGSSLKVMGSAMATASGTLSPGMAPIRMPMTSPSVIIIRLSSARTCCAAVSNSCTGGQPNNDADGNGMIMNFSKNSISASGTSSISSSSDSGRRLPNNQATAPMYSPVQTR